MKRACFLSSCTVLFPVCGLAQCPLGDVSLTWQWEVDEYAAQYANCDTLPGSLMLAGPEFTDLSVFNDLKVIQGDLHYYGILWEPFDFSPFSQLTHIGGDLRVEECIRCNSFDGLQNLERIEGDLLAGGDSLESFYGLGNLEYVGGYFSSGGGPLMYGFAGLNSLDTVMGMFRIGTGAPVNSVTIPNELSYVDGDFQIYGTVPTMQGGNQLTRVDGRFVILTTIPSATAFPMLGVVYDIWAPARNDYPQGMLPALDTVLHDVHIYDTPGYTILSGFNGIRYVGNRLQLIGLDGVTAVVDAFQSLDSTGQLIINGNDDLMDLSAFEQTLGIGNVNIIGNPQLSYCHVQAICDRIALGALPNPSILNNAPDCNSAAEVEALCMLTTALSELDAHRPTLYPNPVGDRLWLDPPPAPGAPVRVLDAMGRVWLDAMWGSTGLPVELLPAGTYVLELAVDRQRTRIPFVRR